MRDSEIYKLFKHLEKPVMGLQRNEEEVTRQIISLRIQLNVIIRVFKVLLPLKYLYDFFYKLEWKQYSRQLMQKQKIMAKFKKEQENKKENKK